MKKKGTEPPSHAFPRETRAEVLAALKRGRVFSLRKGDLIVVSAPPEFPYGQYDKIRNACAALFPGIAVIVKSKRMGFKVVRRGRTKVANG